MLVLNGCVLSVVWVPKGIDNEMGNATLFKREACVFDDHRSSNRRLRNSELLSPERWRTFESLVSRAIVVGPEEESDGEGQPKQCVGRRPESWLSIPLLWGYFRRPDDVSAIAI